ncbi:conserved exported hypothetical protein [Hyella patelloides LEGE 07179]|uniref:DUF5666 domain-containing protein n=1 Tax=Hyella patelloides LEGE 07179 TaxID=945734 RepID=A0A563VR78_9CYAN|nr:hypothetical protein [Hyella patelloides]VEP13911.1 conserved exported hypothetical protein [Hyella patelloides LEGE 07179]
MILKTIKRLKLAELTLLSLAIPGLYSVVHAQGNTFTGTVERVWEDGFRLNTGERTLRVDSWDVCGDNTMSHLSANDRVNVSGEFSGLEFDADSITDNQETPVCTVSKPRE